VPDQLEYAFQVRLKDGSRINGKIDRVDRQPDGTLKVIDYKTKDKAGTPKDLATDIPLGAYTLALEQMGKQVAEVELQYVMAGDSVSLPRASIQAEAVNDTIHDLVGQIQESARTGVFEAKPDRMKCSYCDYRQICPFRYGNL
jgi:putative RecB family exonuclease